jgi:hypothetical protein
MTKLMLKMIMTQLKIKTIVIVLNILIVLNPFKKGIK